MNWLIVASRIGAHVYIVTGRKRIHLIADLPNPLGREKNRELRYDQPGMSRGKYKKGTPHRLDREKRPHEEAADQFARFLVHSLEREFARRKFDFVEIAAESRFLGMIRRHMQAPLLHHAGWINKDVEKIHPSRWPRILGYQATPPRIGVSLI